MTNQASSKGAVLKQIEDQWRQLLDSVNTLPQGDLSNPGALGHWSARDMIGHIATWDRELVKVVDRYVPCSEKTDYGNDDAVGSYN